MVSSRIRMASIGVEVAHRERNMGMGITMYNSLRERISMR